MRDDILIERINSFCISVFENLMRKTKVKYCQIQFLSFLNVNARRHHSLYGLAPEFYLLHSIVPFPFVTCIGLNKIVLSPAPKNRD